MFPSLTPFSPIPLTTFSSPDSPSSSLLSVPYHFLLLPILHGNPCVKFIRETQTRNPYTKSVHKKQHQISRTSSRNDNTQTYIPYTNEMCSVGRYIFDIDGMSTVGGWRLEVELTGCYKRGNISQQIVGGTKYHITIIQKGRCML
jgi:hypothetical protein